MLKLCRIEGSPQGIKAGDDGKVDTPVPIPNTEVKHFYADGTWLVTTWESMALPVLFNLIHKSSLLCIK